MGLDRNNIPDEYLCEVCQPRSIDRKKARSLQSRRRAEIFNNSSSSDDEKEKILDKKIESKVKRKISTKKTPVDGRRKHKRTMGNRRKSEPSPDDEAEEPKIEPTQQLRTWVDKYEEAVTNHYSPELRARVSAIS